MRLDISVDFVLEFTFYAEYTWFWGPEGLLTFVGFAEHVIFFLETWRGIGSDVEILISLDRFVLCVVRSVAGRT